MKFLSYATILGLSLTSACLWASDTPELGSITLDVANIEKQRGGQMIIFVFLETGFPRKHAQALARYAAPVTASNMQFTIAVPRKQAFALKVLHDENEDGLVSKNWTGIIPRDGMGFSNGARIRFAPPSFSEAAITFKPELSPTIELQYF